jgi:hypothetical protein
MQSSSFFMLVSKKSSAILLSLFISTQLKHSNIRNLAIFFVTQYTLSHVYICNLPNRLTERISKLTYSRGREESARLHGSRSPGRRRLGGKSKAAGREAAGGKSGAAAGGYCSGRGWVRAEIAGRPGRQSS